MIETLKNTYTNTNTLHHAYILVGDRKILIKSLLEFFENTVGVSTKGNPDFYHREFITFGIDDARALKQWASNKALSADMQVGLLSCTTITREAQNALLKLLEEPSGTHFFFISSSVEQFLSTLRSRCVIISSPQSEPTTSSAKDFLTAHHGERMSLIKKIAERFKDTKDKSEAMQLVDDLEKILHKKSLTKNPDIVVALQEILMCKKYLLGRSPSIKMLLEHIALVVPVIEC